MKTRRRSFAALFAILALTASLAEQGWAAACAGMEGSSRTAVAAVTDNAAMHGAHGPVPAGPGAPAPSDGPRSPDAPGCPMASAAGMACSIAAAPAAALSAPCGAEAHLRVIPAPEEVPVSHLISSLFRPPRR